MNSERRRELLQLVTFNKTCFHSLELLRRWFLFFLFFYSYALFKQWYSLYSTRPLCYREAADRVKRNLSSPVVCWRIWFSRAGFKLLPGSKPGRTSVAAIRSQTWNVSSGMRWKRCVGCRGTCTTALLTREFYAFCALLGTDGGTNACDYTFHRAQWYAYLCLSRKKNKKKKGKKGPMWCSLSSVLMYNQTVFFGMKSLEAQKKESMLLRIKKEVQIDHRWFQCMWFVLWNIWRKLFFNPEVSNRAPRFAAGSSPNQTLQQMMSQITSSRPDWSVEPPLDHFFWCIASHPCSLSPKKLPSRARTFLA